MYHSFTSFFKTLLSLLVDMHSISKGGWGAGHSHADTQGKKSQAEGTAMAKAQWWRSATHLNGTTQPLGYRGMNKGD